MHPELASQPGPTDTTSCAIACKSCTELAEGICLPSPAQTESFGKHAGGAERSSGDIWGRVANHVVATSSAQTLEALHEELMKGEPPTHRELALASKAVASESRRLFVSLDETGVEVPSSPQHGPYDNIFAREDDAVHAVRAPELVRPQGWAAPRHAPRQGWRDQPALATRRGRRAGDEPEDDVDDHAAARRAAHAAARQAVAASLGDLEASRSDCTAWLSQVRAGTHVPGPHRDLLVRAHGQLRAAGTSGDDWKRHTAADIRRHLEELAAELDRAVPE